MEKPGARSGGVHVKQSPELLFETPEVAQALFRDAQAALICPLERAITRA
jgi:hypothetical protein